MPLGKEKIILKPKLPLKQKHSLAGNSYNNICSRNCYKIHKLRQWVYCECIKIAREKEKKNIL